MDNWSEKLDTPLREGKDGLTYLVGSNKPFTGTAVDWFESGQKKRETDYLNGLMHGAGRSWYEPDEVIGNVTNLFNHGQLEQEVQLKNGILHGYIVRCWKDGGVEYTNRVEHGQPIGPSIFYDKDGRKERVVYYRNSEQYYVVWYSVDGVRKIARGFTDDEFGNSVMYYDEFGVKDYKTLLYPGTNKIKSFVWHDVKGNIISVDRKEEKDADNADKTPVTATVLITLLTSFIVGVMSYAVLR